MAGYTKLHSSIVTSTIWQEDHATRIVWITMLATADANGRVEGAIPGLAHLAYVSVAECEHALTRLMAPDSYSRTQEHEGRRIERIDGGWRILNYGKYREERDPEKRREQVRKAVERHRERQKKHVSHVSQCKPDVSQCKPNVIVGRGRGSKEKEKEKEIEINKDALTAANGTSKSPYDPWTDPNRDPSRDPPPEDWFENIARGRKRSCIPREGNPDDDANAKTT